VPTPLFARSGFERGKPDPIHHRGAREFYGRQFCRDARCADPASLRTAAFDRGRAFSHPGPLMCSGRWRRLRCNRYYVGALETASQSLLPPIISITALRVAGEKTSEAPPQIISLVAADPRPLFSDRQLRFSWPRTHRYVRANRTQQPALQREVRDFTNLSSFSSAGDRPRLLPKTGQRSGELLRPTVGFVCSLGYNSLEPVQEMLSIRMVPIHRRARSGWSPAAYLRPDFSHENPSPRRHDAFFVSVEELSDPL